MSTAIAFDTLSYAKKMVKVGFTQQQAEGQAEAMAEIIDEKLATKQDIRELDLKIEANKNELLQKIDLNRGELLHEIGTNKGELLLKIESNKNELLLKLGGMIAGSTGILVILMKLFRL